MIQRIYNTLQYFLFYCLTYIYMHVVQSWQGVALIACTYMRKICSSLTVSLAVICVIHSYNPSPSPSHSHSHSQLCLKS
jgi:hypothetical protein